VRVSDYFTFDDEPAPVPGQDLVLYNPFDEKQRLLLNPTRVQPLLVPVFERGRPCVKLPTIHQIRDFVLAQLESTGRLPDTKTPCKDNAARENTKAPGYRDYPVTSSRNVAQTLQQLYLKNATVQRAKL